MNVKHFLISYLLGWLMMAGIIGTMVLVGGLNMRLYPGPPSAEFVSGTFAAVGTLMLLVLVALPICLRGIP